MATAYDIIIRPIITERAMSGAADKKYVFEVAKDAGEHIFALCIQDSIKGAF